MRFSNSLAALLFCLLISLAYSASAQIAFANNGMSASSATGRGSQAADPATSEGEKMVLVGKITNPAGALPGAVVFLVGTKQVAVTNAEGEFSFLVPANAGPLHARVTYAGYADEDLTLNTSVTESTVNLANAKVIVVSRKQQLKAYMKTAQKEVKQSLKEVHQHSL
jgi:hypothetical protein